MATKKFKNDVLFEALANDVNERIPVIDQFGQLTNSTITSAQLDQLSDLAGSLQGSFAPLINDKIPTGYLPALAITDVYAVANLAARDALSLSPVDAQASVTVDSFTAGDLVGATITIDGVVLTGGSGGTDWDQSSGDIFTTAASINDAINNNVTLASKGITSTVTFNDVFITAGGQYAGSAGNSVVLETDSNPTIILNGNNSNTSVQFSGGTNGIQEGDVVRVADGTDVAAGGAFTVVDYTQLAGDSVTIAGTTLTEGVEWTAATDNDTTASSLATAIDTNIGGISSFSSGATVEVFATQPGIYAGSAGNSVGLSSSDGTNLTVSGATMENGVDGVVNSGLASFIYDGSQYLLLNDSAKTLDDLDNVSGASASANANEVLKSDGAGNFAPAELDSTNLGHVQADTGHWTIADESSIGAHLDEAGDRIAALESGGAGAVQNFEALAIDLATGGNNVAVNTGISFATGVDYAAKVYLQVDCASGSEFFTLDINDNNVGVGDYVLSASAVGNNSTMTLSITAAGVLQISSNNTGTNGTVDIRAQIIRIQ